MICYDDGNNYAFCTQKHRVLFLLNNLIITYIPRASHVCVSGRTGQLQRRYTIPVQTKLFSVSGRIKKNNNNNLKTKKIVHDIIIYATGGKNIRLYMRA
jgi:hypothetical protein